MRILGLVGLLASLGWRPVSGFAQMPAGEQVVLPVGPSGDQVLLLPAHLREVLVRAADFEIRDRTALALNEEEFDAFGQAQATELARVLDELERALSASSKLESPIVSRLMMNLMNAHEPLVRMTALHWLVGRPDVRDEALLNALQDSNPGVTETAMQILFLQGMDQDAAQELRKVVAAGNVARFRLLVQPLLSRP